MEFSCVLKKRRAVFQFVLYWIDNFSSSIIFNYHIRIIHSDKYIVIAVIDTVIKILLVTLLVII